jgi:predicted nucleotidyltransferase
MVVWESGDMPLPEFNEARDLPAGRHAASLHEVLARFGAGTPQRVAVTARLRHICDLAVATGHLDRVVIFGSYVSDKAEPNDLDVILVMHGHFATESCPAESLILFDHARADEELGASIFWVRPDMLLGEPLEQFLAHWERKRDGSRRGIVEVRL